MMPAFSAAIQNRCRACGGYVETKAAVTIADPIELRLIALAIGNLNAGDSS